MLSLFSRHQSRIYAAYLLTINTNIIINVNVNNNISINIDINNINFDINKNINVNKNIKIITDNFFSLNIWRKKCNGSNNNKINL